MRILPALVVLSLLPTSVNAQTITTEPATMPALHEIRTYVGAMPMCWRAEQVVAVLRAAEEGGEVHLSHYGCHGEPDAIFQLRERISEIDITLGAATYRAVIFRANVLRIGEVYTFLSYRLETEVAGQGR